LQAKGKGPEIFIYHCVKCGFLQREERKVNTRQIFARTSNWSCYEFCPLKNFLGKV